MGGRICLSRQPQINLTTYCWRDVFCWMVDDNLASDAASSERRGLAICSSIIIPSFPFLVLAGFIVKSGLTIYRGRWFERPTRLIFGLPGCCARNPCRFIGDTRRGYRWASLWNRLPSRAQDGVCSACVNGGPAFIYKRGYAGQRAVMDYALLRPSPHRFYWEFYEVGSAPDGETARHFFPEAPRPSRQRHLWIRRGHAIYASCAGSLCCSPPFCPCRMLAWATTFRSCSYFEERKRRVYFESGFA